ncbi:MAG: hypothetical protein K2Y37_00390 [Pirellulales bacterium]|nr:hypothetical protein [Pirellulales bacterium]
MDSKPTRPWFRFRLSTVLILTAILAWGMALRPFFWKQLDIYAWPIGRPIPADALVSKGGTFAEGTVVADQYIAYERSILSPRLKWPALALAAFLAWKAAWGVFERRRREVRPE